MSGYVRIHRKLLGHAVFRNDAEALAFAWLVIKAAWKPCQVRYKGRLIGLDRGQLVVSVRDFATAMDRDKAWIERLFKRLKNKTHGETLVETHGETGVNVVTICNYDKYQALVQSGETLDETEARHQTRHRTSKLEEKEEREKASPRGPYVFAGRTIKLNEKHFTEWRDTYHTISDMRAELTSIDAWLQGQPIEQRKKWFYTVPGMLGRKHQEALSKSQPQGVPSIAERRREPLRV